MARRFVVGVGSVDGAIVHRAPAENPRKIFFVTALTGEVLLLPEANAHGRAGRPVVRAGKVLRMVIAAQRRNEIGLYGDRRRIAVTL